MKKITIVGMIVLVSISTLFRGLYFSYETYGFLTVLALLAILYFFSKIIKNEPVHINKPFVLISAILIIAVSLSFVRALNPRENLGLLLLYVELLIIFIILYDSFYDNKQQLIQLLNFSVLLAGFVCAVAGLMALTGRLNIWDIPIAGKRITSTFQYANTASIYFAICCIFAITLANAAKNVVIRSMAVGMGCIFIYALFLTGSRGGYIVGMAFILLLLVIQPAGRKLSGFFGFICMSVPVFITIKSFTMTTTAHDIIGAAKWLLLSFLVAVSSYFIYCLLCKFIIKNQQFMVSKSARVVITISISIVLILAIVFRNSLHSLLPSVLSNRLAVFNLKDESVLYRLEFDKDALKLLENNWILGLGGGGWKASYQSIQDFLYTAIFVHNNYLQVFLESGILGFISYIAIVLISVVTAFYSFIKSADKTLKAYTSGLLCGLLALVIHASFDFDLSFISLTLLSWVMFAASAVSLPGEAGLSSNKAINSNVKGLFLFRSKWDTVSYSGMGKIVLIAISAVLFSIHALYFAGAVNRQVAFDSMQKKNYSKALAYYEEAYRLDPSNSSYAFELAKLYHFYAGNSKIEENKQIWLKKARAAAEKSVYENKGYPTHIGTLVMIYLDSGMPLQALEYAQNLVSYQKYYADNYELLARSYLAAADYYEKKGDTQKIRELLAKCIEIDNDPYLHRSTIRMPNEVNSEKKISEYKHSDELAEYLQEASNLLKKYE